MGSFVENGISPQSEPGFDGRWKAYAFRRNLAAVLACSWPMGCVALFVRWRSIPHDLPLGLVVMFTWLAFAVLAVWWAGQFRCPRCYRRFGALGNKKSINLTRGFFDSVCSNCKLAKFERAA